MILLRFKLSDADENKNNDKTEHVKPQLRLGLKPNINQFLLLILVNAFVGAMIGLEQTVVPLLGKEEFGLESNVLVLSFIASFGMVKAILNLFAGKLSDRWNRKKVLVLGWLFGIPVPLILLFAPSWDWILDCKCNVRSKSRSSVVNDSKHENRFGRKREKRSGLGTK